MFPDLFFKTGVEFEAVVVIDELRDAPADTTVLHDIAEFIKGGAAFGTAHDSNEPGFY